MSGEKLLEALDIWQNNPHISAIVNEELNQRFLSRIGDLMERQN